MAMTKIAILLVFFILSVVFVSNPSFAESLSNIEVYTADKGVLEFSKDLRSLSCDDVPKIAIHTSDLSNTNFDVTSNPNHFFLVLVNANNTNYQYLQVQMYPTSGHIEHPSYMVNLFDDKNKPHGGGLYQTTIPSFAAVYGIGEKTDPEYLTYVDGAGVGNNVTYYELEKGNYDIHALVFASDVPRWIASEHCVLRIHWKFTVDESGKIIASPPQSDIVRVSDVTDSISPLQQFNLGIEPDRVYCRENFTLIIKLSDGSPACVKQVTLQKLRERGWALNDLSTRIGLEDSDHSSSGQIFTNEIIIPKGSGNPELQLNVMPSILSVVLGIDNTVIWTNLDDVSSTIVADDQSWTTGLIKPDTSVSIAFNHTGIFGYHGEPHPWTKGTIIVK